MTFTAEPNDATLMAVMPTSWYGAITASNAPAHRAHEHRVGGKWAEQTVRARGGSEQLVVLGAEAAAVAGVRIERAERDARLGDAEPVAQTGARDVGRRGDGVGGERGRHVAQRNVRGGEDDAQRIRRAWRGARGGEHHRDVAAGARGEQLGVAGKVVAAGEQRVLVERRGDDAVHVAALRELDGALHGEAGEASRISEGCRRRPFTDVFVDGHFRAARTNDDQLRDRRNARIAQCGGNDLRPDAARVAECDGKTNPWGISRRMPIREPSGSAAGAGC